MSSTAQQEIQAYLTELTVEMRADAPRAPAIANPGPLAEDLFGLLTHRQFCHLSRAKAAPYRQRTLDLLTEGVSRGAPLQIWYDIGPGYHASIRPGELDLRFSVGFSEFMILHQVATFVGQLETHYPAGARFWLVVDNLCALRTNDIPVAHTLEYCRQFRELILCLGMQAKVGLIVESEEFDIATYDRMLAAIEPAAPFPPASEDDMENVMRFIGRRCGPEEAAERIDIYRRACVVTERLLADVVRGVRMSQRASTTTLGFRPFPGGDSRTQCGEVVLSRNANGRMRPILLTSRNIDAYECRNIRCPDQLPALIPHVIFAEHIGD